MDSKISKNKQATNTAANKSDSENKRRATFKEKKVFTRKLKLAEINMLNIVVVIVPREKEQKTSEYLTNRNAIILSKNRAKGISRASIFSGVGAHETPVSVIFAAARTEDAPTIITSLSEDYRLDIPGNGKAFMIDVLGYMGAKAPFIEKRSK